MLKNNVYYTATVTLLRLCSLKLQNFLLDEKMNLKLADFGLAAQLSNKDDAKM